MYKLPVWRGWTVDDRLRQFRKVSFGKYPTIEFVEFASEQGQRILNKLPPKIRALLRPW